MKSPWFLPADFSNRQPVLAVHTALLQTPTFQTWIIAGPFPLSWRNSTLLCLRAATGQSQAWITSCLCFSRPSLTFFSTTLNIGFLPYISGPNLAGSLPNASACSACPGGYSLPSCHHPLVKFSNEHPYTFFHHALGPGRDRLQTAAKLHHYLPSKLLFKFSFAIRLKKKATFDITQTTRVYYAK